MVNRLEEKLKECNTLVVDYKDIFKKPDTPKPEGQMIGGVPQVDSLSNEINVNSQFTSTTYNKPCTHKHPDGRDAWVKMTNTWTKCEICGVEK